MGYIRELGKILPTEITPKEEFKITGPGKYKKRNGEIIEIESISNHPQYNWKVKGGRDDGSFVWTNTGHYYYGKREHLYDIVERIEDMKPEPKPFVIDGPGKYLDKKGKIIEIIGRGGGEWPWQRKDSTDTYTNEGIWSAHMVASDGDIVSKVVETKYDELSKNVEKTKEELFVETVKGKKITWTGWSRDTWFIPEKFICPNCMEGKRNGPIKSDPLEVDNGFEPIAYGRKWSLWEEEKTMTKEEIFFNEVKGKKIRYTSWGPEICLKNAYFIPESFEGQRISGKMFRDGESTGREDFWTIYNGFEKHDRYCWEFYTESKDKTPIEKFLEETKGKKIIWFGAGSDWFIPESLDGDGRNDLIRGKGSKGEDRSWGHCGGFSSYGWKWYEEPKVTEETPTYVSGSFDGKKFTSYDDFFAAMKGKEICFKDSPTSLGIVKEHYSDSCFRTMDGGEWAMVVDFCTYVKPYHDHTHQVKTTGGHNHTVSDYASKAVDIRDVDLSTFEGMDIKSKTEQPRRLFKFKEEGESMNEKKGFLGKMGGYFEKHQDFFMTFGVVVVLDYFLLGGALRQRVKAVAEKLLGGCEKALNKLTGETTAQITKE